MTWMDVVSALRRDRRPAVLVTVAAVRGHAPREAGAKMVVTAEEVFETIGGGNLEMTAVTRARELLSAPAPGPEMMTLRLNDKAPAKYGRQCCGGEVTVLLEPLAVPTTIAIFGIGNVGLELARILSRHDVDLHLSDSRPEYLDGLGVLEPAVARIHPEPAVVGEEVIGRLPAGSHVLIMTHDHAEDFHLCDAALRHPGLASIGLIGSSAKWARFRKNLAESGHEESAIDRIDCPIGLPDLPGKLPATIAVSVAAELLKQISSDRAEAPS
ncbi:xanthine dehydrogenase accessory protein XdhC [Zhihengliuella halotolerans]|uniref:xanthine dehydrogenase accessory protein XdhC n=1 Tax=Zhihengliuella halotolerans TaxID=370736 RepID=UPI000C80306A|nr:xanthine dehydrogenase accessory protein XdhC [Zhihengliuella halotolerans]